MREKAIEKLISNWKGLVENGEFEPEEMRESLWEQANHAGQGWDSSFEEFESDPELLDIMGYDLDEMTDEQDDEWVEIVTEAAKRYLEKEESK